MSQEPKKEKRKERKTYPGPNSTDNEQMLQNIRETLAAHQHAYARKSVTPSPQTVRETTTPSPAPELNSPGTTRAKPRPSPVDHERQRKMAQIRDSLKPFASHRADQGGYVNEGMLCELVSRGYDQNMAIWALVQCGSVSIEAATDLLRQYKSSSLNRKHLTAIREDEGMYKSPVNGEMPTSVALAQGPLVSTINQYDTDTTPSSALPGYTRRISSPYSSHLLPSRDSPPAYTDAPHSDAAYQTTTDEELSPTRCSPDQFSPQRSPPPELGSRPHVHVSPPPDVQPRTYSPFSAPFSYRRPTPPVYDKHARLPHGYSPIVRPSSELSDSGIEEETISHRNPVPPEAFKFYMEQHIENVMKSVHQRQQRRMKLEAEMSKRQLDDATCEQMRRLLAQKESNFLRMRRAKMHRNMFDIVKPLGVGAFGVVSLVRKMDNRRLYAMKTLRKADVLRRNQVAHVKAERDILAEADNEWVVKLYYSFQDAECLYFVMEYIPGGDMMSLLIKLGTFPEHLALFYIAELVCAIESVHKMGFIHRDIKPDNILIGADGHIKLTDFGLCTGFRWTHDSKQYQPKGMSGHHHQSSIEPDLSAWSDTCTCHQGGPLKPLEVKRLKHHRCVAHSLVGTPNYIAPEILRRVGYTQLCDWWSVGVIMYEMLVGQPPFMAPTPSETQLKIVNWPEYLRIPLQTQLSPAAHDLIQQFLSDPQHRIGRNGSDQIKIHPFFSQIDWDVGIRNYEAPYKPKIMYEDDTSNFDPIPQHQLQKLNSKPPMNMSGMSKDQPAHAFFDFTFIRFAAPDRPARQKPTIRPNSSSHHSYHTSTSPHPDKNSTVNDCGPSSRKEKKRTATQPVYV